MFQEDESTIFFSLGRCSGSICSRIDDLLSHETKNLKCLESLQGEYCFFYYKKSVGQLIFGRDIFARKSLCWRLVKSECLTFEFSTFPASPENGWHEVFPGTFFIFSLLTIGRVEEHSQIFGHYVLKCVLSESKISADLHAVSYFPRDSVEDDKFVQLFDNVRFTPLPGDHFLKPTSSIVDDAESPLRLMCVEFHKFFLDAVRAVNTAASPPPADRSARLAVLFSGGVDSLMVALAAGRVASRATEIILVNVAFGKTAAECGNAPDRERSINAFKFLRYTS